LSNYGVKTGIYSFYKDKRNVDFIDLWIDCSLLRASYLALLGFLPPVDP
jgi:hypothetical protein